MITANLIVKNEQETLPICLKSIRDFVEDIVIVDTGSTDNTVDYIASCGLPVWHFDWVDDFSAARNYALSLVKTPWTLFLDADDLVLNPQILQDIAQKAHKARCTGVWSMYRQDVATFQRRLSLFKTKDYRWEGVVHETPQPKSKFRANTVFSGLEILHRKPSERGFESATRYLEILMERDPDNFLGIAQSYQYLAQFNDGPRNNALAEDYYWEAMKYPKANDESKYMAAFNVAKLNIELANEEKTRLHLADEAASYGHALFPKRAECLVMLGQVRQALGHIDEAERYYKEAKALTPPTDHIGLVYHGYYDEIPTVLLESLRAA